MRMYNKANSLKMYFDTDLMSMQEILNRFFSDNNSNRDLEDAIMDLAVEEIEKEYGEKIAKAIDKRTGKIKLISAKELNDLLEKYKHQKFARLRKVGQAATHYKSSLTQK